MTKRLWTIGAVSFGILFSACSHAPSVVGIPSSRTPSGVHTRLGEPLIQHVVIIEMENRSFDHLFGTFPGANGIPANPTCNPDPATDKCIYPYHVASTVNTGGPHDVGAERIDLDGGNMDGFIRAAEAKGSKNADSVMGYHTCAEIPTYCSYAQQYVLADNFFAASNSYSIMAHLFLVSAWSAKCASGPMSCTSSNTVNVYRNPPPDLAWTDVTYLLHAHGVSWGYYVYDSSNQFIQGDGDDESSSANKGYATPSLWNPMPLFDDIKLDGETGNIQPGPNFEAAAAAGTLPAVSWVIPPFATSDHPTADLVQGQQWVSKIVGAVQASVDWPTTAIFLQWDEWGGFYDHVVPPVVDGLGYGFRVPMIIISPQAKTGIIDHQLLSSDAELKFIEDTFLGGQRLDPATDGRPDSRPSVRENYSQLGDLSNDFTVP